MDIEIIQDNKKWYSANIKEICVNTQWDSRDELLFNIREALQCYYEAVSQKEKKSILNKRNWKFYFDMKSIVNAVEA